MSVATHILSETEAFRAEVAARRATAERIKALRHRMGLTQAQFAKACGIARPSTVSRWEDASSFPLDLGRIDELERQWPA